MSEQLFYALALAGLMLVTSGCLSPRAGTATNVPQAKVDAAVVAAPPPAATGKKDGVPAVPASEPPAPAPAVSGAGDDADLEGGGSGGPDAEEVCMDLCGDGTCQEASCVGRDCICEESPLSCPADCAERPDGKRPVGG
ncbi:MAG TPA: hypothetical protein VL426_04525 [Candidatus Binatia bacterium]|jgi:hypothetical protein|nr:hypothetical protein [Candidatus Binatia bacterium]